MGAVTFRHFMDELKQPLVPIGSSGVRQKQGYLGPMARPLITPACRTSKRIGQCRYSRSATDYRQDALYSG